MVLQHTNNGVSVVINGNPLSDDEEPIQDEESTTGTLQPSSSSETTVISAKPTASSLPDTLEWCECGDKWKPPK